MHPKKPVAAKKSRIDKELAPTGVLDVWASPATGKMDVVIDGHSHGGKVMQMHVAFLESCQTSWTGFRQNETLQPLSIFQMPRHQTSATTRRTEGRQSRG